MGGGNNFQKHGACNNAGPLVLTLCGVVRLSCIIFFSTTRQMFSVPKTVVFFYLAGGAILFPGSVLGIANRWLRVPDENIKPRHGHRKPVRMHNVDECCSEVTGVGLCFECVALLQMI